jgi:hypothetical protein
MRQRHPESTQGTASGWSRRQFLRGAGTLVGLPFLPSLFTRALWGGEPGSPETVAPPRRLLFMCTPMGFVPNEWILKAQPGFQSFAPEGWFPEDDGPGYKLPAVHAALAPYREHFSFIKGVSNHRYRGEVHYGDDVLLTCADTFADPSRPFSNTISCDQLAAGSAVMGGDAVRYPSLALGIPPIMGTTTGGLSWTATGVPVTPLRSPVQVFDRLFGNGDIPAEVRMQRMRDQKSILDVTAKQVGSLDRALDAADRRKLDEVLSAVRGVEAEIQREARWMAVPKPKTDLARPDASCDATNSTAHARAMLALAHAAFLTDSTRVITYEMPPVFIEITSLNKHALNHWGSPEVHAAVIRNDTEYSNQLAEFTRRLCSSTESDGSPLIHHTLAAFGSGLWGMNHYNRSLPMLLIGHGGGAIKQGSTLKFPETTPMANLWLTMLKASGVPVDSFADSTGTLEGLL